MHGFIQWLMTITPRKSSPRAVTCCSCPVFSRATAENLEQLEEELKTVMEKELGACGPHQSKLKEDLGEGMLMAASALLGLVGFCGVTSPDFHPHSWPMDHLPFVHWRNLEHLDAKAINGP